MREILFRGKRIDNGGWVYGACVPLEDNQCGIVQLYPDFFGEKGCEVIDTWGAYRVIPETVGQYTGLKDKNGKMVFEGDVLMALYGEKNIGKVYMDEACWFGACDYLDYAVTHGVEIIGNIHDNPELLERTEP